MVVAAALLPLVWALLPGGLSPRSPGESVTPSGTRGTLVYAAPSATGEAQVLWNLDVATGTVEVGPGIPTASELVDASYAGIGWVGVSATSANGHVIAYVLRGTSPHNLPEELGSGDIVAWGPDGQDVAIAGRGPLRDGCHRSVWIDIITVESGREKRVLDQPNLCGDILSIGRDGRSTYFTRVSRERLAIYSTVGDAHLVLEDHGLLSVSPESDLLVIPRESLPALVSPMGTQGPRDDGRPHHLSGPALYWRDPDAPVRLGTPIADLIVKRVLAWSEDSSQALVVGQLDYREGLFLVNAGPGPGDVQPNPLHVVSGGPGMGASFAEDGTLYIVINGHLLAYADGMLADVLLPDGAPAPSGPIVWIP